MNQIELNAILRLRRDNDYNYEKIKNTFIPQKGEPCLVDTTRNGLRIKVGDGKTAFADLPFVDEYTATNIVVRGYFYNGDFYSDAAHTELIYASVNKIYIDAAKSMVYIYDGIDYIPLNETIAAATPETAGVVKLYDTVGQNTDGTMTQKAISDELDDKVEIETDVENETLIFFN